MSIHKSKGLEFPVVFLSGTGKKFNMQDLNSNLVLLDQDIGIGPKYMNYQKGITYNTLARDAIKYKSKIEMLSEEMRILYVALTRAKEKLIITGVEKDYKKSIDKKEEILNTYESISDEYIINKNITSQYLSYLDWIELVNLNSKSKLNGILITNVYKKNELIKTVFNEKEQKEENLNNKLKNIDIKENKDIKEKLNWEYKHKIANNVLTKSSVSKIKTMKLDLKEDENIEYNKPEFLEEEKELTSAQKGTLMHLVLQKLDEKIIYDKSKILELLENLREKNIITNKEMLAVNLDKIYNFTKTKIWEELKSAKLIEREKPFYINIPAKEIYNEDIEEDILVQGIIDLYYITNDDKLVLVDYKTDKVQEEAELIKKYKMQLEIYRRALEKTLNIHINKMLIYSTYLNKEIKL